MKSFNRGIVLVVCVLALVAVADFAEAQAGGRISGKVVDQAGNPIEGLQVTSTSPAMESFILEKTTNKKGTFVLPFTNSAARYVVELKKEGYKTLVARVNPVAGRTEMVEYVLLPATGEDEAAWAYTFLRDNDKAEEERRRSIAIGPDVPDAYGYGAWTYVLQDGATDRARGLVESAPDLGSPQISYVSVLLDLFDRKPDSALARLQASPIEGGWLSYSYEPIELLECMCLSARGAANGVEMACMSAVERIEREIHTRPNDYRLYSALGRGLAFLGRKEDAVRAGEHATVLMPISKDSLVGPKPAIELAKIYTQGGETDKALDLIDELLSIPSDLSVGLLRLDPVWDPLRDHPRFQALLEKYDTD